jgi:hypothetical protein
MYWKKLTLFDQWNVIRQDAVAPPASVFRRVEAGERLEVVDEVCLIEVSALDRELRPVWSGRLSHQLDRALKPLHPAE